MFCIIIKMQCIWFYYKKYYQCFDYKNALKIISPSEYIVNVFF